MSKRRIGDGEEDGGGASALRSEQLNGCRTSSSSNVFASASSSAKRSSAEHAAHAATAVAESVEWLRPVDVRAFGLEDRAEAVIATGRTSWSLAHLSKWRSESLSPADIATPQSSKEYVRQRQRAYMKQCLAKPATQ